METSSLRQDLINRLNKLRKNKDTLSYNNFRYADWESLREEVRDKFDKSKLLSRLNEIIAYVLLAVLWVISIMKELELGNTPDLNKAALFILLIFSFVFLAFGQKIRTERLGKQLLVIEILEKIDVEEND